MRIRFVSGASLTLAVSALVAWTAIGAAPAARERAPTTQIKATLKKKEPTAEAKKSLLTLKVTSGLKKASADSQHWGAFKDDGCMEWTAHCGLRQYSSVLWGIPWGASWEDACATMPADVASTHFDHPSQCVNVGPGINEWGEFDVPDSACRCHPVCRVDPCGGGEECVHTDPNTGECDQISCVPGEVCDQTACC